MSAWHGLSRRSFVTGVGSALALGVPWELLRAEVVPTLSLLPFLARPTRNSILVNARNGHMDAEVLLEFRPLRSRDSPGASGASDWIASGSKRSVEAGEFVDWDVGGLEAGAAYEYRVQMALAGGDPLPVATGRFTTQRTGEDSFTAALMTDAHTGAFHDGQAPIQVLDEVTRNVRQDRPEFVLALGDNVAWPTSRNLPQTDDVGARRAYDMYRRHTAPLTTSCPHFGLIGNWEGETGKVPEASSDLVAAVRHQYTPGPNDQTYAQGGSPNEDYYAFDWGPVLFVVLNVQSYTEPSGEAASVRDDVTIVEDWTLGGVQFEWMERVLKESDHPFKFICIHHAVGGNAANETETLYGRGGGRAANVGEQGLVHEMMQDLGVQIFFHGHDHVFVDQVVDGIHYTMPGSCGAPWRFGREITGYRRHWADAGHGRLIVRPDQATVEFVSQAGQVIHEFAVTPGR